MLQEITQMKAKVFNEEKLIREKMKTMARLHDTKVLFFLMIIILLYEFIAGDGNVWQAEINAGRASQAAKDWQQQL